MTNQNIKIHAIHSDPVVSAGLRAMLSGAGALDFSMHDSLEKIDNAVIIADYQGGVRFCQQRHAMLGRDNFRVLIVTHHDKEWDVRQAINCGVQGYLLQSAVPDELVNAVRAVADGRRYLSEAVKRSVVDSFRYSDLTDRESEVLQLLGQGYCNKLIARELGIGVGTVKTHMKSLMAKLNVTARTPAVIVATQRGLLGIHSGATHGERMPYQRVPMAKPAPLKSHQYY